MRGLTTIALGTLAALQAASVNARSAPDCANECANNVLNNFKDLGCANAQDFPCLCKNGNLFKGAADCMKGTPDCTLDRGALIKSLNQSDRCQLFKLNVPAEESTSKAAPSSTSAPVTSTSAAATTTSQASTSVVPTTTSSSVTEASTEATSSTTSEESSTTSASTAPATESTSAAAAAAGGSGLSYAATVGIGVGVAAAVVAAAIVGFCLLKNRKRNTKPRQSMDISKPLPGSGRTYPSREREQERDSFEKYAADIEMTTNRYEDMVPRTQPRTMV